MKMIIKYIIPSLLLLSHLNSCVQNTSRQSNESSATTENSEQIEAVKNEGIAISSQLQQVLGGQLKRAVEDSGIAFALKYCNIHAYPLTDSIESLHGVKIQRVTHKARNPLNKANEAELAVIRDFNGQLEKEESANPLVTSDNGNYLFYAPIMVQAPLCLKCHGVASTDILPEDYIVINMLYPEDEATGFSLNELRGIWKIEFDKNHRAL